MMAAGRDEGRQLFLPLFARVDRCHHRNVGQVCAAEVRVVEDNDVAWPQCVGENLQRRAHRGGHCPQVHWHVRRLGHHISLWVEHGAREVAPLLDVGRVGRALQRHTHFLGHRLKHILEDFQADRINGHESTSGRSKGG